MQGSASNGQNFFELWRGVLTHCQPASMLASALLAKPLRGAPTDLHWRLPLPSIQPDWQCPKALEQCDRCSTADGHPCGARPALAGRPCRSSKRLLLGRVQSVGGVPILQDLELRNSAFPTAEPWRAACCSGSGEARDWA